jgi:hypothetical protein
MRLVELDAKASILPFVVGTMGMLEVMALSTALSVETFGCVFASGHRVSAPPPGYMRI